MIKVEVAYALADTQWLIALDVPNGTTAEQAIIQSGILESQPSINLKQNTIGVFSKVISKDTVLQNGDRVEIYRPLSIDPKQKRLIRANQSRSG